MFSAPHEWRRPSPPAQPALTPPPSRECADLYRRLARPRPDEADRMRAAEFIANELDDVQGLPSGLPDSPEDLLDWMAANTQSVQAKFALYREQRRAGAPRAYFTSRAHALYFLRSVAPTKLVDGAWLYGLLAHWRNPGFSDLVRTYVEELGEGERDKNHVVLYRGLLARYGLDPLDDLPDALYRQGLIQLALGWNARAFLPEIVGFNLGYEQLPLHLLITAYELNELGLDPYYFTLHVTVDNAASGHARRACQSVADLPIAADDGDEFWRRVCNGAKLACTGLGTTEVIGKFDVEAELLRILRHKAAAGCGAHSDYCRLGGRHVNEWLAEPDSLPAFLRALQDAGWLRRGEPVANSRFWRLVQGERAEMFGVFTSYELQVLHDWIRGADSADGRPYDEAPSETGRRRPTFRATPRGWPAAGPAQEEQPDAQAVLLEQRLAQAQGGARTALLVDAMSPARHWTPAGLLATRLFWRDLRA
jgi:hypothetical protein